MLPVACVFVSSKLPNSFATVTGMNLCNQGLFNAIVEYHPRETLRLIYCWSAKISFDVKFDINTETRAINKYVLIKCTSGSDPRAILLHL